MSDARTAAQSETTTTVLIVEDEVDVAELYEMWLSERYAVRVAHDGSEALEQLDESIDIVLLDRRMPGISGDAVLDEIRSRGFDCRVAIVSAVTPDFDVIEMGFDDYLTKPVDKGEVIEAIERMLRRSSYDTSIQEYYQLVAKETALQEAKTEAELQDHTDFQDLRERRQVLERDVDQVMTDFGQDDFEAAFRDFE